MIAQALSSTFFNKRNVSSSSSFYGSVLSSTIGSITEQQALCLSALYCGVNIISNDIAVLPKAVFTKDANGKKQRTPTHPAHNLIAMQPNQAMHSYTFHKIMQYTALIKGNGIAIIQRNQATGQPIQLHYVQPTDLKNIKLVDGQLYYFIQDQVYAANEVIHIKGFTTNGYAGVSVLKHAAQNLNAALKAEQFAVDNFEAKGFGLGIIESEKSIDTNGKKALNDAMETRLSKGGKYNVGTLDEGMKFKPISVSAKEAELIDWKKTTVEDVARWLNLNVNKLKATEGQSYNTLEQNNISHVQDSITPWVIQWENEYNNKLLTTTQRITEYTKFNINALLRADIKSKADYYMKMRYAGIMSGDEIRLLEDLDATDLDHMVEPLQPVQIQQQSQIQAEHE